MSAVFVGIVTSPLLICQALGLGLEDSVHIVGMSLAVSGIATFVQCRKIGPVGDLTATSERFSPFVKNLFQLAIATGGLVAIVLNVVLPRGS